MRACHSSASFKHAITIAFSSSKAFPVVVLMSPSSANGATSDDPTAIPFHLLHLLPHYDDVGRLHSLDRMDSHMRSSWRLDDASDGVLDGHWGKGRGACGLGVGR